MSAFHHWIRQQSSGNRVIAAGILFQMSMHGPRDSIAWTFLEQTGDKSYTPDTYLRAADIALSKTQDDQNSSTEDSPK